MTTPLRYMRIRNAEDDCHFKDPSVTSRLNGASSPVGGAFGNVRSFGHKGHQGWDLYASENTAIHAIGAGVVEFLADAGEAGYGRQVCLRLQEVPPAKYPQGLFAFYAHLGSVLVAAGERVQEGQVIGLSGRSGNAGNTPPHVHFEVRTRPRPGRGLGDRVDPGELLGYDYYTCRAPLDGEALGLVGP